MPRKHRLPEVWAYVRLSREDLRGPGATEEKLAVRADICRRLARENGLPLPDERILCERESGGKLANRPELLRILELAAEGRMTHLVTPAQDRVLRGDKRDEATIEDAFCRGRVTLLTTQGITEFGPDYDSLVFDVLAAGARAERRWYIQRRKEANKAKALRNQRYCSYAPYGYRRKREVRDADGNVVSPAYYEAIPDQYAVLEEIFRRVRSESCRGITRDLNARGVPPPSACGKRATYIASAWSHTSIREILRNPFYAGRHAQRQRIERGRTVRLGIDDYILAEEEGDWPHPISLEEWYGIQAGLDARKRGHGPRGSLLTGMIHCSEGERMLVSAMDAYGCQCRENGARHRGISVCMSHMDTWARQIAQAVIAAMPEDMVSEQPGARRTRRQAEADYARARRAMADAEQATDDLMRNSRRYIDLFGEAAYQASAAKARAEYERACAELGRLEGILAEPDRSAALPLLARLKAAGERFWEEAPLPLQRQVIQVIIKGIRMWPIPEGHRFHVGATVEFWPFARPFVRDLPPYQGRRRDFTVHIA